MPDLTLPPLLAHEPESSPAFRWRLLVLPALVSVLGMLIALAAATSGQDQRREIEALRIERDINHYQAVLARAKLKGENPETITWLENKIHSLEVTPVIPYARYGRQFTQWDAYRYEEIVDQGYLYHQPNAPKEVKESNRMADPHGPPNAELRWKNVVWYPLYPLLGWLVSRGLDIPSTLALTLVSWTSCFLASLIFFLYARRHFYTRQVRLAPAATSVEALPAPLGPSPDQPALHDLAATLAVTAVLVGPCSIFLYANFTESLFILLLACFLYCLQSRWWWRAALIAGAASACRSQGVLFGPILALVFLLRDREAHAFKKIGIAAVLGIVSAIGILCYMVFLQIRFHDALAFMHGQIYWHVGLDWQHIRYAANPVHALSQALFYAFFQGPMEWPHLWESLCVIWPPILLLLLGGRYLSFELEIVGWLLWGLPYVSNSMAGGRLLDTPWMSMGRFMAVLLPAYIIGGAILARHRWLILPFFVVWISAFALFAYQYGAGNWVG